MGDGTLGSYKNRHPGIEIKRSFIDCSLLDLSMYITHIFRADKFTPGTKEEMFKNGTVDKIFAHLKEVCRID